MTPAQRAIGITGIGRMAAMSGVDRRLLQRIKAGTVTPRQHIADRIMDARARYIRESLTAKVEA